MGRFEGICGDGWDVEYRYCEDYQKTGGKVEITSHSFFIIYEGALRISPCRL